MSAHYNQSVRAGEEAGLSSPFARPAEMQDEVFLYSGSELEAMVEAQNYYRWILRLSSPYVGKKVMEVGAGVGNFAASLLEQSSIDRLVLVEPAANLLGRLQERFISDARVQIVEGELGVCNDADKLDTLIAVNVIEHVEDDARFLKQAFDLLTPGGAVVLFAPALQFLYGSLDAAFDHFRRYSRSRMVALLRQAGFRVERTSYLNFAGIFSWLLAGKVFRQETLKPAQVRFYDRYVIPVVSTLEGICEPPLGQNLLAIGRKPDIAKATHDSVSRG